MEKIIWKLEAMLIGIAIAAQVQAPVKQDDLRPLIEKLATCESGGNPMAYNKDDGGSPSLGLLQFKTSTWNYYIDKYGLFPYAEPAERQNLMWDRDSQILVAERILSEKDGWRNWTNCIRIIGGLAYTKSLK